MKQTFKSITKKLAFLLLAGLLIGQGSGYLAQKLMVENNIRERVRDALSKIVDNNKYVINVDIDLEISDEVEEQITVLAEREGQKVVKLDDFYFNTGSTQLNDGIKQELAKVVDFVKAFPDAQLRIETYTDSRGGSSTNFKLTQARSDAIKKYLVESGVPATTILYSIGYGEDKILNNCTNGVFCLETLHKKNQRSLVVVLNDNVLFD